MAKWAFNLFQSIQFFVLVNFICTFGFIVKGSTYLKIVFIYCLYCLYIFIYCSWDSNKKCFEEVNWRKSFGVNSSKQRIFSAVFIQSPDPWHLVLFPWKHITPQSRGSSVIPPPWPIYQRAVGPAPGQRRYSVRDAVPALTRRRADVSRHKDPPTKMNGLHFWPAGWMPPCDWPGRRPRRWIA